jgi:catechol 2,3-dioxygenase-like lactoylglutathione lyase family enzyme
MDFKYELTVIPVSDVDRAKEFYAEKLGFNVDVDHGAGEHFRVVQLTPPGSAASITIGTGMAQAEPGTYKGMHLVVDDLVAARDLLVGRGGGRERAVSLRSRGPSRGHASRATELRQLRHLQRSGWQQLARPGSHGALTRPPVGPVPGSLAMSPGPRPAQGARDDREAQPR